MTARPIPETTVVTGRSDPPRWLGVALLLPPALVVLAVAALTPTAALFPHQGDVELYLRDATAAASGGIPYRDFRFEYPPFAILAMVVPYALSPAGPPDLDAYKWLFAAWEATLLVVLGVVLRRLAAATGVAGPAAVAGRLTLLSLVTAPSLAWRYDLLPTVLAALAVLTAVTGQAARAGALLAIGTLAKLFPIVILPALGAAWLAGRDLGRVARLVLGAAVAGVAGFLPFLLLAGLAALDFLGYQAARGLQVESLGGGLTMLVGAALGQPVELDFQFSAVHVTGPFAEAWLAALPLLMILGFGLAAWVTLAWVRAGRRREGVLEPRVTVGLATAWLLALLVTSKVFSVQYVVWLVPFAALLPRGQLWLSAAIGGLSMAVHPWSYGDLIAGESGPILLLNVRNGLVLGLFGWVVVDLLRAARGTGRTRADPRPSTDGSSTEGVARPAGLEPTTFRSAT